MRIRSSFRWLTVLATATVIAAASVSIGAAPVHAAPVWFVTLNGDGEVPGPGDPDGDGVARVVLDAGGGGPTDGQVCVRWDILHIAAATSAELDQGAAGDAGTKLFDLTLPAADGTGDDCATGLDGAVVQSVIDDPQSFFLNVKNGAFPNGAVRGQLERFDVVRINVAKAVCPPSIQTKAQLLAAPPGTCTPAARTGDIGNPPAGHVWDPKPLEFNMQIQVDDVGGTVNLDDAELDGGGTCGATTCSISRSYSWADIFVGQTAVTELTFPKGYRFGWATVQATTQGQSAPAAHVQAAIGSITFDTAGRGDEDGFTVLIYDFRNVAGPTPRPTPRSGGGSVATLPPTDLAPSAASADAGFAPTAGGIAILVGLAVLATVPRHAAVRRRRARTRH